jgi:hypothetical protein
VDSLRHEITAAVQTTGLSTDDFRPLAGVERAQVLAAVMQRYVLDPHRVWWWEVFRCRGLSVDFAEGAGGHWLSRLLEAPERERVWFIAGVDEAEPALVYACTVTDLEAVLDACYPFEYYVAAHDYSWLACENHHDVRSVLGLRLIRRLHAYARQRPADIRALYPTRPRLRQDAPSPGASDTPRPPAGRPPAGAP